MTKTSSNTVAPGSSSDAPRALDAVEQDPRNDGEDRRRVGRWIFTAALATMGIVAFMVWVLRPLNALGPTTGDGFWQLLITVITVVYGLLVASAFFLLEQYRPRIAMAITHGSLWVRLTVLGVSAASMALFGLTVMLGLGSSTNARGTEFGAWLIGVLGGEALAATTAGLLSLALAAFLSFTLWVFSLPGTAIGHAAGRVNADHLKQFLRDARRLSVADLEARNPWFQVVSATG